MTRKPSRRPPDRWYRIRVAFHPRTNSGMLNVQTSNRIPSLVTRAAREGGYESNAHYIRSAVLSALEGDLGIDFEELAASQPSKWDNMLYRDPGRHGGAGSAEEDG